VRLPGRQAARDVAAGLPRSRAAGPLGLEEASGGPLYGDEKRRALADADLFVVPSRSENFGIAVAEALAAGLPVIATKATPWADIDGSCGWWVDLSAVALARALATAMQQSDEQRTAMGDRGRLLIQEKYRWPIVARAMTSLYRDLIAGLP
jgi:glycosyltransferase involved in cell wall biosynthesis